MDRTSVNIWTCVRVLRGAVTSLSQTLCTGHCQNLAHGNQVCESVTEQAFLVPNLSLALTADVRVHVAPSGLLGQLVDEVEV
jgi:hypothetical protein